MYVQKPASTVVAATSESVVKSETVSDHACKMSFCSICMLLSLRCSV